MSSAASDYADVNDELSQKETDKERNRNTFKLTVLGIAANGVMSSKPNGDSDPDGLPERAVKLTLAAAIGLPSAVL
jgi:hypothetical protein